MIAPISVSKCLYDGKEQPDVSTVSFPEIAGKTITVPARGGDIDLPDSRYGSMKISLTYNGVSAQSAAFYAPGSHALEFRYVQTSYNDSAVAKDQLIKIFADVIPLTQSPGEVTIGEAQENSVEFEVTRYRQVIDGKETLLIDKLTGKIAVNGKDISSAKTSLIN